MTSFDRPLAGGTLVLELAGEIERTRAVHPGGGPGRTARTLIKDGPLRVTLIVLDAGAEIPGARSGRPAESAGCQPDEAVRAMTSR